MPKTYKDILDLEIRKMFAKTYPKVLDIPVDPKHPEINLKAIAKILNINLKKYETALRHVPETINITDPETRQRF